MDPSNSSKKGDGAVPPGKDRDVTPYLQPHIPESDEYSSNNAESGPSPTSNRDSDPTPDGSNATEDVLSALSQLGNADDSSTEAVLSELDKISAKSSSPSDSELFTLSKPPDIDPASPYLPNIPERFSKRKKAAPRRNESPRRGPGRRAAPQIKWSVGDVINGKYEIVEVLGEGGMGKVFKVRHLLLSEERYFALKLLHPHYSRDPKFRKRFVREVEAATKFVHENAVQIRDFGETDTGSQFFTMDFSEGKALNQILWSQTKLDVETALDITRQILNALVKMHAQGVVHRDLKPGNIVIEQKEEGIRAMLLDFGIAKILDREANNTTERGAAIGTPQYMSPEQIRGKQIDARSDLYSMGVILYEMLVGETPFSGKTSDVLMAHLTKNPDRPSKITPALPYSVERLILKALSKNRDFRFQSALDFIRAIDAVDLGDPKWFHLRNLRKYIAAFVIGISISVGFYSWQFYKNIELSREFDVALENEEFVRAERYLQQIQPLFIGRKKWEHLRQRLDHSIEFRHRQQARKRQQAQQKIRQATVHIEDGKFDAAEALLAEAETVLPDAVGKARRRLQQIRMHHLRADETRRKIEQAAAHIEGGKFAAAEALLAEAEAVLPDAVEKAREHLRQVRERRRLRKIEQQLQQAEEWIGDKKFAAAEALLEQIEDKGQKSVIERLQQLQKLWQQEQSYFEIAGLSKERQLGEWPRFLQKYPTTSRRRQIQEKIAELQRFKRKEAHRQVKKALARYEKRDYATVQKILQPIFSQPRSPWLSKKARHSAAICLSLVYYRQRKWQQAEEMLQKLPTRGSTSEHLLGLVYLHRKKYDEALKLLVRPVPAGKENLRRSVERARVKIYNGYFDAIATEREIAERLLASLDFYPIGDGFFWNYRVTDHRRSRRFSLAMVKVGTALELVDSNGNRRKIIVKKGFVRHGDKKVLPRRISIDDTWKRRGYQVEISATDKIVEIEAGRFKCLVVEALAKDGKHKIVEYYAPTVGEVKMERYVEGKRVFERQLVDYKSEANSQ